MKAFRQVAAALCLLFVWAVGLSVHAQTNQGQMAGNVADQSGAYVAGATITATNEATGSVYTAISTSAGAYHFPSSRKRSAPELKSA